MDPLLLTALILLGAAISSVIGLLILQLGLRRVFAAAPYLNPSPEGPLPQTSLTVVVPAYNEAANIEPCVSALLSAEPPCSRWEVVRL